MGCKAYIAGGYDVWFIDSMNMTCFILRVCKSQPRVCKGMPLLQVVNVFAMAARFVVWLTTLTGYYRLTKYAR